MMERTSECEIPRIGAAQFSSSIGRHGVLFSTEYGTGSSICSYQKCSHPLDAPIRCHDVTMSLPESRRLGCVLSGTGSSVEVIGGLMR